MSDSVYSVKNHPQNPALFMTASYDGTICSYDTRAPNPLVGIMPERVEFNDVAYHPVMPETFVTADDSGGLLLHDSRVAFRDEPLTNKTAKELASDEKGQCSRKWKTSKPSSITFAPDGSLLCSTFSRFLPTLYEISHDRPLATVSAPVPQTSDNEFVRGYRNTTTTKHSSFGQAGNKLYLTAGSDDFNAYVWQLPSVDVMRQQREMIDLAEPPGSSRDDVESNLFLSSKQANEATRPCSINVASSILSGHRGIVNTSLFHPTLPLIFTSGIEKLIQIHSNHSFSKRNLNLPSVPRFKPRRPRPGSPRLLWLDEDDDEDDDEEYEFMATNKDNEIGVDKEYRESRKVLEHFDLLMRLEQMDQQGMNVGGDSDDDDSSNESLQDDSDEDGRDVAGPIEINNEQGEV
ncbi:hypothetical protein OIO90_005111 [Microbotryomycetes sp. JL221]|nr:hypothetical protein OIO90_005111 [Microbotryomycetes sp. JL221]